MEAEEQKPGGGPGRKEDDVGRGGAERTEGTTEGREKIGTVEEVQEKESRPQKKRKRQRRRKKKEEEPRPKEKKNQNQRKGKAKR